MVKRTYPHFSPCLLLRLFGHILGILLFGKPIHAVVSVVAAGCALKVVRALVVFCNAYRVAATRNKSLKFHNVVDDRNVTFKRQPFKKSSS
jgi:hypothetical protein